MTTAGGEVKPDSDYAVAVVGAGIGGVYATHRLTSQGPSVQDLEAAVIRKDFEGFAFS
jgi:cation diffusion facilitator CzcD-associated flavoprotein CzcO